MCRFGNVIDLVAVVAVVVTVVTVETPKGVVESINSCAKFFCKFSAQKLTEKEKTDDGRVSKMMQVRNK